MAMTIWVEIGSLKPAWSKISLKLGMTTVTMMPIEMHAEPNRTAG